MADYIEGGSRVKRRVSALLCETDRLVLTMTRIRGRMNIHKRGDLDRNDNGTRKKSLARVLEKDRGPATMTVITKLHADRIHALPTVKW